MDVGGLDLSRIMTCKAKIGSAPVIQAGSNEKRQLGAEDSKVSHRKLTQIMQDQLDNMNVSLKYFTYGDSGRRIAIAVVNTITGEVIREIPTKELRALHAKMNELVGMIFDRQI